MLKIVYTKQYNLNFFGVERLHPFDSKKYGRAWKLLKSQFQGALRKRHLRPDRQVTQEELRLVHSEIYLRELKFSSYVARAVEIPPIKYLPSFLVDHMVLRPMRWATRGTMLAAESAVKHGLAVNLGGGYHHAKPTRGEGFCIYADAAIAVEHLRQLGTLKDTDRVVMVDTDAHQGNGPSYCYLNDSRTFLFDVFHSQIYPAADVKARKRVDCAIPVSGNTTGKEYLNELRTRLPSFLDSVSGSKVGLAVYNAGTDVFRGDPLGGMNLSEAEILSRDLLVINELRKREIPTIMLLSGGYTSDSYRLVANTVAKLIEEDER